jgi:hypothetical protein
MSDVWKYKKADSKESAFLFFGGRGHFHYASTTAMAPFSYRTLLSISLPTFKKHSVIATKEAIKLNPKN